jgi:protein-tyrosine phosphatase
MLLTKVNRQVWIGDKIVDQFDVDQIIQSGITADIDLRGEDDENWVVARNPLLAYCYAPAMDDGESKPTSWFSKAWNFAEPRLGTGAVVLTHCHSGFHRSASMAVFLLMARWQMDKVEAYDAVVTAKPAADPIYIDDAVRAIVELGLLRPPDPGSSKPDTSKMPFTT